MVSDGSSGTVRPMEMAPQAPSLIHGLAMDRSRVRLESVEAEVSPGSSRAGCAGTRFCVDIKKGTPDDW